MSTGTRKYEVSDPAYYDPLIADQKKGVRQHPEDAKEWLELGRLHEAKINMINYFANRNFFLRYFLLIYALFVSVFVFIVTRSSFKPPSLLWKGIDVVSLFIIVAIALISALSLYMVFLRYPPSGSKYFRKAIVLDPDCGEAFMYLGLISLRRHQKRKACRLLEKAIQLNVNNKKIERELKSIYENEFMAFFSKKTNREVRQQKIIDSQLHEIRKLRTEALSLKRKAESLTGRAEQAKWETSRKVKLLDKEMTDNISAIRQDYEDQIASLKKAKELREETSELAERDFIKLTTKIMEAKASLERQSLEEAALTVENIMGSRSWQALSERARCYLGTAEYTLTMLAEEKKPDYGLVGMELCKALETEINLILVQPFTEHLNGSKREFLKINQTGENKAKPSYFSYLAKVVDEKNYPDVTSLTLGQYCFVLERTLEGEYALKDYSDFLDEICSDSGVVIGKTFLKKLKTVTKKYRNAIVHHSPMNQKQCDHLRDLIFAGGDALLKTCCRLR